MVAKAKPLAVSHGKPIGNITRGTTNPNRLRRVDRFIAAQSVIRTTEQPVVVDLGFGASPITAIELLQRLSKANPNTHVVGVEIDRERVERGGGVGRTARQRVRGGSGLGAVVRDVAGSGRGIVEARRRLGWHRLNRRRHRGGGRDHLVDLLGGPPGRGLDHRLEVLDRLRGRVVERLSGQRGEGLELAERLAQRLAREAGGAVHLLLDRVLDAGDARL